MNIAFEPSYEPAVERKRPRPPRICTEINSPWKTTYASVVKHSSIRRKKRSTRPPTPYPLELLATKPTVTTESSPYTESAYVQIPKVNFALVRREVDMLALTSQIFCASNKDVITQFRVEASAQLGDLLKTLQSKASKEEVVHERSPEISSAVVGASGETGEIGSSGINPSATEADERLRGCLIIALHSIERCCELAIENCDRASSRLQNELRGVRRQFVKTADQVNGSALLSPKKVQECSSLSPRNRSHGSATSTSLKTIYDDEGLWSGSSTTRQTFCSDSPMS